MTRPPLNIAGCERLLRAIYGVRDDPPDGDIADWMERGIKEGLLALAGPLMTPRAALDMLLNDDDGVWLRELVTGSEDGPYWLEWHCEPPAPEQAWRAVRQERTQPEIGLPVRRVYQIEIPDARTGNTEPDRRDADRDGPAGSGPGTVTA